uniref:Photosystem II reaction center X protein n=1 Tax=Leersia perrieri TaxID=77586 RepID=A0A0D9VTW3_9ORYZ
MAASATAVAASLSVAGGLGRPLVRVGAAPSLRTASVSPRRAAVVVRASAAEPVREKAAAAAAVGLAAVAAVAAALTVPEVAEAAPAFSPSLKNFLLSIASGGVVLFGIVGAVVAVSNFDPVKRT